MFRPYSSIKQRPHGHPHPQRAGNKATIVMSGVISPDLGLAGPSGASFNPLKRRNTQIPEFAAEHPAPAATGHGTYRMDPMMTEHLALIGFAARLGTSLTSDAAEASATRNDAQLLMNMLSSRHGHKPTTAAEECIGRLPLDEVYHGSAMNSDTTPFAFSCPSLSIDGNHQRAKRTMTAATGRLILAAEDTAVAAAMDGKDSGSNAPKMQQPADLLGRTLLTHQREGVSEATDVMARNVLQAFSVALEWRYSAWVGSLAKVLRLKKALMAQQQHSREERQQQGSDGGEAGDANESAAAASFDEDMGDGYDYAEATAIEFLARTISDLSVIDVKTAFRVQQPSDRELVQPKKRIKVRQVTLENVSGASRLYERSSALTFEAVLTVLVGPSAEPMRVVLGTGGTITGTFAGTSNGAEGEEVLVGVDLKLDTDGLAHSMEEQSRLLVRAAAETAMGGGGGASSFHATLPAAANAPTRILDLTQPPISVEEQQYSPHVTVHNEQYSPVPAPKPVVITPRQGNSPSSPFSSAGGAIRDRAGVEDGFTISLPVAGTPPAAPAPSTPKPTVTPTKAPAKMSSVPPTSMTRSVSVSSTTNNPNTSSSKGPSKTFLISPKPTTRDPSSLPKLVSPSPVQLTKALASGSGAGPDAGVESGDTSSAHSDSEDSGPRAADSEWYTYQRKGTIDDTKKEGPKLPALLEACAAIASTKA